MMKDSNEIKYDDSDISDSDQNRKNNKITYTGYHLFGKLNLKGDFHSFYDNLMNI